MDEKDDYKELCHQVIGQWQKQSVLLNPGATAEQLSALETQIGLILPNDFRYFYLLVNGMPDLNSDDRFFSLWPIARMIREPDGIIIDRTSTPPRVEIAFGDFLIDSHRFHLVRAENDKFYITAQIIKGENLAESFTGFLELYLSGSDKLGLF